MTFPRVTGLVKSVLVTAVVCISVASQTQAQQRTSAQTTFFTCLEDDGVSRAARSATVASPNGENKAYAVVQTVPRGTGNSKTCLNFPHIFVSTPKTRNHEIFGVGKAGDNICLWPSASRDGCYVNGAAPLEWSRDNRYLLVELVIWMYKGDSDLSRIPGVYDAQTDQLHVSRALTALQKHFGENCAFDEHPRHFSGDERIAIEVTPIDKQDEDRIGLRSCTSLPQTLIYDWRHERLEH